MAIERIVVGVDGSEGSLRALRWSADLAGQLGAEIVAVHIVPQSWLIELNAFQVQTKAVVDGLRAKLIGEWTEPLRECDVSYSTELLRGDPSRDLLGLAQARHADLVVIGATHHGSLRNALLGGTAHRLVNASVVPVVVVPTVSDEGETEWVPIPG